MPNPSELERQGDDAIRSLLAEFVDTSTVCVGNATFCNTCETLIFKCGVARPHAADCLAERARAALRGASNG